MTFNSPPQKDGWGDDVKKEPQKSWAMWFQNVWLWIQNPTAPTQAPGDNTTAVATDAFVQAAVAGATSTLISSYLAPINNTGASVDVALGILQSAYVDVTAATTIPLHVATATDQIYEVFAINKNRTNAAPGFQLYPNNTNYGNVFTYREVYEAAAAAGGAGLSNQPPIVGVNAGQTFMVRGHISTATAGKMWQFTSQESSATTSYAGLACVEWQDTTTVWTSLGTFQTPNGWTGRVFIRRIQ